MFNFLLYVGMTILQMLTASAKPPSAKKVALSEVDIPTATEDRAQSIQFGTSPSAGNVIWYGDYDAKPVTKRVRVNPLKKVTQTIGYRYRIGLWLSLSAATCDAVREIRLGDKVVWSGNQPLSKTTATDLPVKASWTVQEGQEVADGMAGTFRFFNYAWNSLTGSPATPPANPYMQAQIGRAVPAYPNSLHAVWLGPSSGADGFVGSTPNIQPLRIVTTRFCDLSSAVVQVGRNITYPVAGSLLDAPVWAAVQSFIAENNNIDGYSTNPAFAIAEILTTRIPGIGPKLTHWALDLESFFRAAETLKAENHGVSFEWSTSRPASEVVDDILKQINARLEDNTTNGTVSLRLIRASDALSATFNDDNIIEMSAWSAVSLAEAPNRVQVTFADRTRNYEARPVIATNSAGVRTAGAEIQQDLQFIGVDNYALASALADRERLGVTQDLVQTRFTAIRPLGQLLKPGHAIQVTHPTLNRTIRMRVQSARYGDYSDQGRVEIEALEDIFRTGVPRNTDVPAPPLPPAAFPPAPLSNAVLTPAPYALTGSDRDLLLYYARDSGTTTTGYSVASKEEVNTWAEGAETVFWDSVNEPAIAALLQVPLATTTASPGLLSFTLSDAAVEQYRREVRDVVYAIVGAEWMEFSVFTLDGNTLKVGSAKRAIFDTVPQAHAAGATVTMLLGYAVDVQPLTTYSTTNTTLPGLNSAVARAESRGPGGVLSPDDTADSQAAWVYDAALSRAARPLIPGGISLSNKYGALSPLETAPAIGRMSPLTLSWRNRNRLLRMSHSYFSSESYNEPGCNVAWSLEYEEGSSWYPLGDGLVTNGATSVSVSTAGVPVGARRLRAKLRTRRPVGSEEAVSNEVTVYWTLEA